MPPCRTVVRCDVLTRVKSSDSLHRFSRVPNTIYENICGRDRIRNTKKTVQTNRRRKKRVSFSNLTVRVILLFCSSSAGGMAAAAVSGSELADSVTNNDVRIRQTNKIAVLRILIISNPNYFATLYIHVYCILACKENHEQH